MVMSVVELLGGVHGRNVLTMQQDDNDSYILIGLQTDKTVN